MVSRATLVVISILTFLLLALIFLYLHSHHRDTPTQFSHLTSTTPSARLPEAVIFGVKKAGTEALKSILNSHLQIVVSSLVNFYDKNYDKGVKWYVSALPHARPAQVLIDRTPAYFTAGPDVPRRIFRLKPDTLLIMVARDPVDRFVSDYLHWEDRFRDENRSLPFSSFRDFAFLQSDWPDGTVSLRNHSEVSSRLDRSCYASHFSHWVDTFPPEQILVVNGDQLKVAPWIEIARVQKFLGVKQLISAHHFVANSATGFYCWRVNAEKPKCLSGKKGRPHPELTNQELELLRRHFSLCNRQFRAQLSKLPDPPTFQWPY